MEGVAERNYRYWGFPNSDAALLHALRVVKMEDIKSKERIAKTDKNKYDK